MAKELESMETQAFCRFGGTSLAAFTLVIQEVFERRIRIKNDGDR